MSGYDTHEEEIKAFEMVNKTLSSRIDSLGRTIERIERQKRELTIDRNRYREQVRMIDKAVVQSRNDRDLFVERNRRSWR